MMNKTPVPEDKQKSSNGNDKQKPSIIVPVVLSLVGAAILFAYYMYIKTK